ncbi:hypothetical protein D3C78_1756300 [compost metagenome]
MQPIPGSLVFRPVAVLEIGMLDAGVIDQRETVDVSIPGDGACFVRRQLRSICREGEHDAASQGSKYRPDKRQIDRHCCYCP